MEATDTTKAELADEVIISGKPPTATEVSAQKAVIQMPKLTSPKRRAPRGSGKAPPINANVARVYPPDGATKLWWSKLKNALGTNSNAFVDASLFQLQAAARLPGGGISEIAVNAALALSRPPRGALAVQMACTHTAAMAVLVRLGNGYGGERWVAAPGSAAARQPPSFGLDVRIANDAAKFVILFSKKSAEICASHSDWIKP